MGNRTFLSVTTGAAEGQYEDVAFETNNFLAPLWFSLVSQGQYQHYRERLITTWDVVKSHLDHEDLEDLPEWEAFTKALTLHIPWGEAEMQLRQSLPLTLARFPALGPYMLEWLDNLKTHVRSHQSPVIHMELGQYFYFYEEPLQYLKQLDQCLQLWWGPDEAWFERWNTNMNPYLLGGEHLPKREGSGEERTEEATKTTSVTAETQLTPSTSAKRSKRLEGLYTWLLAILSGALCIGTLLLTSNTWLAVVAFLLPAICIVLWELLIRPKKKIPPAKNENSILSPTPVKITYFRGVSPIKPQGIEAVNLDMTGSFTVPWDHIKCAQVREPNQIMLVLHTAFESLYSAPVMAVLNDELDAEHVTYAINTIANLLR